MNYLKYLFIFSLLFSAETVFSQDSVSYPIKLDATGFQEVFAKVGDLYISCQPSAESFSMLKSKGVTTVVNLRTDSEMSNRENVPFDESAVVDSLGMKYIHIPLGGPDSPYNNEALIKFANALKDANGKVLLHCKSGRRANYMYAAYLIQYKGFSPNKAIEYAKAVNFGEWPLEALLGKKLNVEFE